MLCRDTDCLAAQLGHETAIGKINLACYQLVTAYLRSGPHDMMPLVSFLELFYRRDEDLLQMFCLQDISLCLVAEM